MSRSESPLEPASTEATGAPAARPRRRNRLVPVIAVGVIAIVAAFGVRQSPWAHEYQLKRANLTVLTSWATETPSDPLLQYYLGTNYSNAGQLPEAHAAFQRAVSLDPKMSRAYVGIAGVQLRLGQYGPAQAAAQQALSLDKKSVDAQYLLGVATYQISKSKARLEFERLTRMAPKRGDAWYWLGKTARDGNDATLAIAPLQKAVQLEPENALYQRELGKAFVDVNRFDQAHTHLEHAIRLAPNDPEANYLLGRELSLTATADDGLKRAEELMRRSIDLMAAEAEPDSRNIAAVALEWAEVLRRLKRSETALAVLQKARKTDPTNIRILHQLGLTAQELGKTREAMQWLGEYKQLAERQVAVDNLVQRVKQDEKNPALRLQLARAYEALGNHGFALNQYDVYLSLKPSAAEVKRERQALMDRLRKEAGGKPAAANPADVKPADGKPGQ